MRSWIKWSLVALFNLYLWVILIIAGFNPSSCAAETTSSQSGCDYVERITFPATWFFDFIETHDKSVVSIGTIAVAIFTFTLYWSTRGLWKSGERQWILTKEAQIADKRAFVFPSGLNRQFEIEYVNDESGAAAGTQYNWRLGPIWQNTGHTPTRKMRFHVSSDLRADPHPPNFDFTAQNPHQQSFGILAPHANSLGGVAPIGTQRALTPQVIREIAEGERFFYIWGWVRYFDVFPETEEHITRFYWRIVPVGNPFIFHPATVQGVPDSIRFDWFVMNTGNCADEECGG